MAFRVRELFSGINNMIISDTAQDGIFYNITVDHRVLSARNRALPQQHHLLRPLERPGLETIEVDAAGERFQDIQCTTAEMKKRLKR
jgi:hypothetical protein